MRDTAKNSGNENKKVRTRRGGQSRRDVLTAHGSVGRNGLPIGSLAATASHHRIHTRHNHADADASEVKASETFTYSISNQLNV